MSKHHDLKILSRYYESVREGRKTFEVRRNDRDFKNNDTVTLKEWDENKQEYLGGELDFRIGYVLHLSDFFGDQNKYVVFSLLEDFK